MKDYYYILGLNKNASKDEIKKAYRKLSLKFHPDHNIGDKFFEDRFRDVKEAYETLVDDAQRRVYDDNLKTNIESNTDEKSYSYKTASQSKPSEKKQQQSSANKTSPASATAFSPKKKKSNDVLFTIIGIVIFLSPFVLNRIANQLGKKDSSGNYTDTLLTTPPQASYDTTATFSGTEKATELPPVSSGPSSLPDSVASSTTSQNDDSHLLSDKDGEGLTAQDVVNNFLQAPNNGDCNTAWDLCYDTSWVNSGKGWFCSNNAFGGVRKVLVHYLYALTQNTEEVKMYADYYAEDAHNGNKCFKQEIAVQKLNYTDNKVRWKITKMTNIEKPVVCDENQSGNTQQ